ncbi:TetR/AcrR family transcriptional regulator [Pararhizobium sp. BT-229]|uniref:TetR/AcrR family transcriptional regulator n=1 Tax=Pararhizobium sp. BT-229 TaxID=2986923 RepID=UPI0021F6F389|nr:TetR/AcrR family transcriptional regulator [Pararhizobium sp. BT-229]MCV9967602.1 TetR/AcrR family transcriptional regulator [Pararhizobium sp. BT-229]
MTLTVMAVTSQVDVYHKRYETLVAATSEPPKSRRKAVLRAATEVFFEQGYAATSIDAIIERAGGSKRTIYNEFGNKEGLFSAIVTETADKVLSSLAIEEIEGHDLRATLTAFGQHLMGVYTSPTLICIYRTVVTEAKRFPDLVKSFYEQGPGRATARLAEVLEAAKERGEIRTDDCLRVAGHFVSMIRDNPLQVILGLRPPPSEEEAQMAVASAVEVLLNGVRHYQER